MKGYKTRFAYMTYLEKNDPKTKCKEVMENQTFRGFVKYDVL
eukprot:CAMPEP_0168623894 /NCGR_PEP_ID=MMETSP0449_2-20121227/9089_1 /TAXON_ID=1082188 /ORGANISM="Strombidium rassoulzadegani, Strain ras09" /LENGTH=41 /DNA_ID= /DNA_START= /DNA_END= /DNA_ORIENTATION=